MKNIFTRQDVADEIGISKRTLARRIKALNLEFSRQLLTTRQLIMIYEALRIPLPDDLKKSKYQLEEQRFAQ
jgi:predicted DNA binding protein